MTPRRRKPKALDTIRRELRRAEKRLRWNDRLTSEPRLQDMRLPAGVHDELYGVQQALAWVLGLDAMPPVKAALSGAP